MKKIKNFRMFENQNYQTTSWADDIDGVQTTITIQEVEDYLEKMKVPITEIKVEEIINLCAHRDKTDKETLERSERASLDYPIIVSRNLQGKFNMILDGMHRVLKARNHNLTTIKARILDLKTAPVKYQQMFR
jgi:hypothetical protein